MKRTLYTLLALIFTLPAFADTITIQDGDINNGDVWTADNEYLLDGFVFVEAGNTLTINAGTVVRGKANVTSGDNASALIIMRGAMIMAEGTADNPIIFTAEFDDLSDPDDFVADLDAGSWGGIIILGEGIIARPTDPDLGYAVDNIEGIPSTEVRAEFGGTNNEDNSGVLKYVSIRYGGADLNDGDEINGLTLGGVGSGTTLEYIEIFANDDDGIEWFGGAAEVKYLISAFCSDDGMDYDYGWRGKGQYWFVVQRADGAGNGGEHDGAKPDGESPFSKPTISNATYIGAGVGAAAENEFAILMRDNAGGFYHNSIFTDFTDKAISIEDLPSADGIDSHNNLMNGDLAFKNNYWFDFGAGNTLEAVVDTYADGDDADASDVIAHLTDNNNLLADPKVCSISRDKNASLDPSIEASAAAASAAVAVGDAFFDDVPYVGAFAPGALTDNWAYGWTALYQEGYLGRVNEACSSVSTTDLATQGFVLGQNNPNPVVDAATITYTLPVEAPITMNVYNTNGQIVSTILNEASQVAGEYTQNIDAKNLASGIYYISLETQNTRITRKMVVTK